MGVGVCWRGWFIYIIGQPGMGCAMTTVVVGEADENQEEACQMRGRFWLGSIPSVLDCPNDDNSLVRTLTMGFSIRVDEDVSKDTMVQMCGRLSEMFGEGHEFRPLGNKGILNWARWPGKLGNDILATTSLKEMRLMIHPKVCRFFWFFAGMRNNIC